MILIHYVIIIVEVGLDARVLLLVHHKDGSMLALSALNCYVFAGTFRLYDWRLDLHRTRLMKIAQVILFVAALQPRLVLLEYLMRVHRCAH